MVIRNSTVIVLEMESCAWHRYFSASTLARHLGIAKARIFPEKLRARRTSTVTCTMTDQRKESRNQTLVGTGRTRGAFDGVEIFATKVSCKGPVPAMFPNRVVHLKISALTLDTNCHMQPKDITSNKTGRADGMKTNGNVVRSLRSWNCSATDVLEPVG